MQIFCSILSCSFEFGVPVLWLNGSFKFFIGQGRSLLSFSIKAASGSNFPFTFFQIFEDVEVRLLWSSRKLFIKFYQSVILRDIYVNIIWISV